MPAFLFIYVLNCFVNELQTRPANSQLSREGCKYFSSPLTCHALKIPIIASTCTHQCFPYCHLHFANCYMLVCLLLQYVPSTGNFSHLF